MADKTASGAFVCKKQTELETKQLKSLGMSIDRKGDFADHVFRFKETEDVSRESHDQNIRIETQMHALDKNSPTRTKYDGFKNKNDRYQELTKSEPEKN